MKKTISIVTINFNSENETHQCLSSLFEIDHSDFDIKIIVVDNGSKEIFKLTKAEQEKDVFLIRSDINLGFSGGNNLGISKALGSGSDYVLIINNDTYHDKNFLKELFTVLEKSKSVGAAVPKIYFAKGHEFHKNRYKNLELGKVFWYAGGFMDFKNALSVHRGVDEVDKGQYDVQETVDFATGCCILFKREVLEKVGLFDDRYFLYFEDADLSMRIIKSGFNIMYVPSAFIWHINAASSGVGSTLQDYFITRNRLLFGFTYGNFRLRFALYRESMRILFFGRLWQKLAIRDFYFKKFEKGSWGK